MSFSRYFTIAVAALALASCHTPKDIAYFTDTEAGSTVVVKSAYQLVIQPGDKLRIVVSTPDERLLTQFNLQTGTQRLYTNNNDLTNQLGYTVQANGTILFPVLGEIPVQGMTRDEVAMFIQRSLKEEDLVRDPIVLVDFLNMGVTVLGDVKNPGNRQILRDGYTVLDAITDAGDLNITGDRKNVKVIREEVGKQKVYEIDLTDAKSLTESPVYFLQQNDVVYVTPNEKRLRDSTTNGNTPYSYAFWISIGSFLISTATLIWK
ncbi:MAG: polysaccharide export protein [Bacteroidales bacterium]|nr:polysaccharide export protein [Bacteroidales bacterium]